MHIPTASPDDAVHEYPTPGKHVGTGYAPRQSRLGREAEGGEVEDRSQEQRKHIFAINGSPDFLNVIRDLFQEEDYNVTTTNFVPNSFEQIAALDPDALIVDIAVGQWAGWELLERLNAEAATTGIPVLVVSTDPTLLERVQDEAARYGQNRFLIKPFGLEEILAQIREMVGAA
jgi:DNA-binding response OmpR family regulator